MKELAFFPERAAAGHAGSETDTESFVDPIQREDRDFDGVVDADLAIGVFEGKDAAGRPCVSGSRGCWRISWWVAWYGLAIAACGVVGRSSTIAAASAASPAAVGVAVSIATSVALERLNIEFRHSLAFPNLILGFASCFPNRVGVTVPEVSGIAGVHGITDVAFHFVEGRDNHLEFLVALIWTLVVLTCGACGGVEGHVCEHGEDVAVTDGHFEPCPWVFLVNELTPGAAGVVAE